MRKNYTVTYISEVEYLNEIFLSAESEEDAIKKAKAYVKEGNNPDREIYQEVVDIKLNSFKVVK